MKRYKLNPIASSLLALLWSLAGTAEAGFFVQCPGDVNGDAVIETACDPSDSKSTDSGVASCTSNAAASDYAFPGNSRCKHITAGDGFAQLQGRQNDNEPAYFFGFHDVTGKSESQIGQEGLLAHETPSPTIIQDEGDMLFLNLSNVGMVQRPDLADPHTVHYHGFPNAAAIFDGVPEVTVSINEGATLTYFYKAVEPGTYFYHCHVEAAEHMQMGMMGNLWVRPAQNRLPDGTDLDGYTHSNPDHDANRNLDDPLVGDKYVYNDGDGSTRYDVEFPVQLTQWDPVFHDASRDTQPLPFADMKDTYTMVNGRVYPDTLVIGSLPIPAETTGYGTDTAIQPVNSRIEATAGERILLRMSNISTTEQLTMRTLGLTMRIVGQGQRILRGDAGQDLSYETSSVTLSGGEAKEAIIDTAGVTPGTYYLYTTNLEFLSNDVEDYGGAMTEIVIN